MFSERKDYREGRSSVIPIEIINTVSEFAN